MLNNLIRKCVSEKVARNVDLFVKKREKETVKRERKERVYIYIKRQFSIEAFGILSVLEIGIFLVLSSFFHDLNGFLSAPQ